jgi:hypothetical protein
LFGNQRWGWPRWLSAFSELGASVSSLEPVKQMTSINKTAALPDGVTLP